MSSSAIRTYWSQWKRALVGVLLVVALAGAAWGCDGGNGGGGGGVPWGDYASDLKGRIDALAGAKDCVGLQNEFDVADANNDATRSRTGHSNADLMAYIDGKMRAAGCYE